MCPRFFIISIAVLFLTACATPIPQISPQFPTPPHQEVGILQAGDSIDIKFTFWPDLDDSQTIRPDGYISMPMVDEVLASGLTPAQLDKKLTERYSGHLRDPELTVIVRGLANRSVYITGEVFTPGELELKTRLSVLAAIMAAGGYNPITAEMKSVIIIRHLNGKRYAASLDLSEALNVAEAKPFYLTSQDIVHVPRTKVVELNQWVEQHITRMFPDIKTFRYERTLPLNNGSERYGLGQ